MTWWSSAHWLEYERAYGHEPGTRARELTEATWLTHVVDLTQTEEELWRKIPKTMRQAVRKGETVKTGWTYDSDKRSGLHPGLAAILEWHRSEVIRSLFSKYRDIHIQANGGAAPRNDATYTRQLEWLIDEQAFLIVGDAIGACLVIRYQGWCYYASGPSLQPHVMPALIWAAMKECKRLGDRWFEVGWLKGDTEKGQSIAKFKARWGGENKPANWLALEAACQG